MNTVDRKQLAYAADLLASTPDASMLFNALGAVIRLSHAGAVPVALTGVAEPLNPLVDLYCVNREGYDGVLAMIEKRRAEAGLPPLSPPVSDAFDKRAYMRQFMDRKRQRLNRAVDLENLDRPQRDKLRGTARLDFCDMQAAKWKVELDRRVDAARAAAGGPLDKATATAVREQFWNWIDEQLDAAEAKARYPVA